MSFEYDERRCGTYEGSLATRESATMARAASLVGGDGRAAVRPHLDTGLLELAGKQPSGVKGNILGVEVGSGMWVLAQLHQLRHAPTTTAT